MDEQGEIRELTTAVRDLITTIEHSGATTNDTAQILLSIVPLVGIVFGCTLFFFFLLWNYRLRRELIRTNQYKERTVYNLRVLSLLIGILSTAVGIPMTILFLSLEGVSYGLLGGAIPFFVGIGLLVFYAVSRKEE